MKTKISEITTPLVLRDPAGNEKCIAEAFEHPLGLLYFELFWNKSTPDKAAHIIKGKLIGEGPWRIGEFRIRTLGCHNTDPHLVQQSSEWASYLANERNEYPPKNQIADIAKRMGAKL
tara:strand:+ start:246 stop:599 length:354 start_codon:yes stop_codon:yes gene_type:complete